jgi:hypothetical protein
LSKYGDFKKKTILIMWLILGHFFPPKKLGFVYVALPSYYLLPGCENLQKNKKTITLRAKRGLLY